MANKKPAKKTEKVKPATPAKKSKPRSSVVDQVRNQLAELQNQKAALAAQESRLNSWLAEGAALVGKTPTPTPVASETPQNGSSPTLEVAFRQVLQARGPLTVKEAEAAILRNGYKTKASSFRNCLGQVIFKMKQAKTLVVDGKAGREAYYRFVG